MMRVTKSEVSCDEIPEEEEPPRDQIPFTRCTDSAEGIFSDCVSSVYAVCDANSTRLKSQPIIAVTAEKASNKESSSDDEEFEEQCVYLCAKCDVTFDTFQQCQAHLKEDHVIDAKRHPTSDSYWCRPTLFETDNPTVIPLLLADGSATGYGLIDGAPVSHNETSAHSTEGITLSQSSSATLNAAAPRLYRTSNQPQMSSLSQVHSTERVASRLYRCPQKFCTLRFSSTATLQYHQKSHMASLSLGNHDQDHEELCNTDGKKNKGTNTDVALGVNQLYKCPECGLLIVSWRTTVLHLWKDHQIDCDLYSCDICDYRTASYYRLLNHYQIHSTQRNYVCMICNKDFKQIGQLRNHMIVHKDKKATEARHLWYSPKVCTHCQRTFSDARCLKNHIQTVHLKIKKFECQQCGYQAARKGMLKIHMRQHTGEKPYVCEHPSCDYRTCDHNSLRRHRMTHSGEKPYHCPHCSYACIQAISYKQHLLKKHPNLEKTGLFECELCSFKTVNGEKLLAHRIEHQERHSPADEQRQSNADKNEDKRFSGNMFSRVKPKTRSGNAILASRKLKGPKRC